MKKVKRIILNILVTAFIIAAAFQLQGCDPAAEIAAITEYINYFLDIEAETMTGTENTEFLFKANTNDILTQWIVDDKPVEFSRTVNDNELLLTFAPGTHTISGLTINGATDDVNITVDAVEIIYKLSATTGDETSPLEFDGQDITGADKITITNSEYYRTISIKITVDQEDSFCFINNNAWEIYSIDLDNMTAADIYKMIDILFPEQVEPVIPDYSVSIFALTAVNASVSDYLIPAIDSIDIGAKTVLYSDNSTYADDTRYIGLSVDIDNKDNFFFINNNMQTFFNIDLQAMSYDELVIAADILNRYPEEGILKLQEVY